jgi:hypothetical protein
MPGEVIIHQDKDSPYNFVSQLKEREAITGLSEP